MLWIVPTWFASLIVATPFGYYLRGLSKKIAEIDQKLQNEINPPKQEEPGSMLIDPDDPVQTAMYEHKKMMEKLNGK